MSDYVIEETADQRTHRVRKGRLAIFLSIAWWVVSIGGIIYVINTTS